MSAITPERLFHDITRRGVLTSTTILDIEQRGSSLILDPALLTVTVTHAAVTLFCVSWVTLHGFECPVWGHHIGPNLRQTHWTNASLKLVQRLRPWPSIKPAFIHFLWLGHSSAPVLSGHTMQVFGDLSPRQFTVRAPARQANGGNCSLGK